ncbi:hypothetical protein SERLA73DRAFT_146598, partial [Serpula lacrymans var. lacrymans S7.3]
MLLDQNLRVEHGKDVGWASMMKAKVTAYTFDINTGPAFGLEGEDTPTATQAPKENQIIEIF